MSLIKSLKDISKSNTPTASGKGVSLGEMIRSGISVPFGFVILAEAFAKFFKETDLNVEIDAILGTVDVQKSIQWKMLLPEFKRW
jgi:phosphoenolpyruvate synthase/pyruvate phosphate dikinase